MKSKYIHHLHPRKEEEFVFPEYRSFCPAKIHRIEVRKIDISGEYTMKNDPPSWILDRFHLPSPSHPPPPPIMVEWGPSGSSCLRKSFYRFHHHEARARFYVTSWKN